MVEVTQEDMLAAATANDYATWDAFWHGVGNAYAQEQARDFARHRITALAAKEAELAAVRVRAQASAEMAEDYHAAHIEQRRRADKAEAQAAAQEQRIAELEAENARLLEKWNVTAILLETALNEARAVFHSSTDGKHWSSMAEQVIAEKIAYFFARAALSEKTT